MGLALLTTNLLGRREEVAKAFGFSKKGDPTYFRKRIEALPRRQDVEVTKFLKEVAFHAAERAEQNAPILTGLLRAETVPMPVRKSGTRLISGVGTSVQYGLAIHEYQMCMSSQGGPVPDVPQPRPDTGTMYGFGPVTKVYAKSPTPEGGPGGKFIARVLNYHANMYLQKLADALRAMLQ